VGCGAEDNKASHVLVYHRTTDYSISGPPPLACGSIFSIKPIRQKFHLCLREMIVREKLLIIALLALSTPTYAQQPEPPSTSVADPNQTSKRKAFQEDLRRIGQEAVLEQLRGLRGDTQSALQSIGKGGKFASSTDLIEFHQIDDTVRAKINGRKEAIRKIIWETASRMETNRDVAITLDDRNAQLALSEDELQTAERLNNAIKDNNISLSSLGLAIKMTVNISQVLHDAASRAPSDRKYDLYVEYTALAYELGALVVDLLDNFQQKGIDDLRRLHDERRQEVDRIKGRINNRIDLARNRHTEKQITAEHLDREIDKFNNWLAALNVSLDGWKEVFSIVDKQEIWAKQMKSKGQVFRDLRDDAGLQLDVLAELGTARAALLSIDSIKQIVDIAEVPLLTLDESIAREIIGLTRPIEIEDTSSAAKENK
jgi:hypothetical protein